jgi:hypothetical protein
MNQTAALDELNFIKNIISESRRSFALNGKPYIFWGILIVVGLLLESFRELKFFDFNYMYFFWILLVGIGWVFAYLNSRKHKKETKTKTFAAKIVGAIWLACGISMTIFGFLGTISGAIKGIYVSPVLCLVLAIAYFVTGVVYDYRWQRNLSIGWWAGAVFMFFYPSVYTNLIMAFMMITLQILPGIFLLSEVKK